MVIIALFFHFGGGIGKFLQACRIGFFKRIFKGERFRFDTDQVQSIARECGVHGEKRAHEIRAEKVVHMHAL